MRRLAFLVGIAVGYVLGTRAGHERYEQISKAVRTVAQHPAVQQAGRSAKGAGGAAASRAGGKVADRVGDRLPSSVAERIPGRSSRRSDDWGDGDWLDAND